MSQQLNLNIFFRQPEVRDATINAATVDHKLRALLKALDRIGDDSQLSESEYYDNGDAVIRCRMDDLMRIVSISEKKRGVSQNTLRRILAEHVDPRFLTCSKSNHSRHTFTIHWLALINAGSFDPRANGKSVPKLLKRDVSPAAAEAVDHTPRIGNRAPESTVRNLDRTGRQVGFEGVTEGVTEGVKQPVLTPSNPHPVFNPDKSNINKQPSAFKTGCETQGVRKRPFEGVQIARFRPQEESENWLLLDRIKRVLEKSIVLRTGRPAKLTPSDIYFLWDKWGDVGAFAKSDESQFQFFAEAARANRVARNPSGLLKEQVFRNRRYASNEDRSVGRRMIQQLPLDRKNEQIEALMSFSKGFASIAKTND